MGAAALHSSSTADVHHLVCLALELLPLLQAEEGGHALAGDELAALLILQQLGTLGKGGKHACLHESRAPDPITALTQVALSWFLLPARTHWCG